MRPDREPLENLGGGHGRLYNGTSASEPETLAATVVARLGERYWRKSYGDQDAFACLIRTILSQNTSDVASQPAFDTLLDRFGDDALARSLANASHEEIVDAIQGAGLYNRKATVIRSVAEHIRVEFGGAEPFDEYVRSEPIQDVRKMLLSLDGIGPKTADCVLLFSAGCDGIFPVDTHVHRIYRRIGVAPPDADHEEVRQVLEATIPAEHCGFGHTTSIQFGREYCTARRPACFDGPEACLISDLCERVGVNPEDQTVIDPATVAEDEHGKS